MSQGTIPRWVTMRDDDSAEVERLLREEFPNTDAYRYNSASIRVRIIDPRFHGTTEAEQCWLVEPCIQRLPTSLQSDIMFLLTLAPGEAETTPRGEMLNLEFEDPIPPGFADSL